MKKLTLLLCVAALVSLPLTSALAFHDGGVARCNACHTMHNSENGQLVDPTAPNGNPYLLNDGSPSDVCLNCHATSRGAVWGSDPLNPPPQKGAGNFVFGSEDNLNDGYNGHLNPILGHQGVHNVIAPDFGGAVDPVLTSAPGGNYPSAYMSCTSCHDPHGNEHFRLLYGIGHVEAGDFTFTNPAPIAQVGPTFSSSSVESRTLHTAYNSGMSAWCANCHGNYHNNNTQLIHPSGRAMGASIAQIYNRYNGTMDQMGGNPATSYIPDVAFEDPAMTPTSTAGPTASSQISCISCHRAHGSSAPNIGRWDFNVQFLNNDGVASGSYPIPNPYVSANQRSLCNKCHNKDEGDHNPY